MRRAVTRLFATVFGSLLLGMSVAWANLQQPDPRALVPHTPNEAGFVLVALAGAAALGVWTVRGLLALKASPVPSNVYENARMLALIEEQHRTLRDLSETASALRHGMVDMNTNLTRVADTLDELRKAG